MRTSWSATLGRVTLAVSFVMTGACAESTPQGPSAPVADEPEVAPVAPPAEVQGSPSAPTSEPDPKDALREKALLLYRQKINGWLDRAFLERREEIEETCGEIREAKVQVKIGSDLIVGESQVLTLSGDAEFDGIVEELARSLPGKKFPDPPSIYPDMAPTEVNLRLSNSFLCGR